MNQSNKAIKKAYKSPLISKISLDKQISITMTSPPPGDPPLPTTTEQNYPYT